MNRYKIDDTFVYLPDIHTGMIVDLPEFDTFVVRRLTLKQDKYGIYIEIGYDKDMDI